MAESEVEEKIEHASTDSPKEKGGKLKGLPFKVAIKLPSVDVGILVGGLAIAAISATAAVVSVHVFLPAREVQIIRNPQAIAIGRSFNRSDIPGFTVGPDIVTDFVAHSADPHVDNTAYIHPQATVLGSVEIAGDVFIAPQASIRGDVGQNIYIGDSSAVLDGAVVRGRPTEDRGFNLQHNQVVVRGQTYSVYIGDRSTLAAQCQVYGPVSIGDDTFIGEQALVDHATIGSRCVLEPRSAVIGVKVASDHYVPAGVVVRDQTQADILPIITGSYDYRDTAHNSVVVDTALAKGYNALYPRSVPPPAF